MTNGECHIGSANAANIKALAKNDVFLSGRIDKVEAKQDWILYLIIVNLVAFVLDKFI